MVSLVLIRLHLLPNWIPQKSLWQMTIWNEEKLSGQTEKKGAVAWDFSDTHKAIVCLPVHLLQSGRPAGEIQTHFVGGSSSFLHFKTIKCSKIAEVPC